VHDFTGAGAVAMTCFGLRVLQSTNLATVGTFQFLYPSDWIIFIRLIQIISRAAIALVVLFI
jgi:hypothetical protein